MPLTLIIWCSSLFNSFFGTSRNFNTVETNTQVYCQLADGFRPNIRQAVAGNAIVLLNGVPSNSVPGIFAQWMPVARLRCL